MMVKPNPKMAGTCLHDCIPQRGKCSQGCNQCFFNRPGAFYTETPTIPTLLEVGDGIVRMNAGNDSNNQRELVIETSKVYPDVFFNTSVPEFDFPGPVVFTANPREEEHPVRLTNIPNNLMFVRLRTSFSNLDRVHAAAKFYNDKGVPVVLTFMAYYDKEPNVDMSPYAHCHPLHGVESLLWGVQCYEWRVRHINSYWCPTKEFIDIVMGLFKDLRLVSRCETWCKDCLNCETYYIQSKKRMRGA